MWYVLVACLAYWVGKRRATRFCSLVNTQSMSLIEKERIIDEKRQHCDMSLYLMQKSMASNDAYELDEWLGKKGLLGEHAALLAELEGAHHKKFNMTKEQLTFLFEESYLRNYEKFANQYEKVLNS